LISDATKSYRKRILLLKRIPQKRLITFIIHINVNCFSEDSGLEVEALNGEPGVHSAYYAGDRDAGRNMDMVLKKMEKEKKQKRAI
jgi:inosine/xanthosine triphosphate pyrophosphatase family protein